MGGDWEGDGENVVGQYGEEAEIGSERAGREEYVNWRHWGGRGGRERQPETDTDGKRV